MTFSNWNLRLPLLHFLPDMRPVSLWGRVLRPPEPSFNCCITFNWTRVSPAVAAFAWQTRQGRGKGEPWGATINKENIQKKQKSSGLKSSPPHSTKHLSLQRTSRMQSDMHLIPDSDNKSNVRFIVSGQNSGLHDRQILIYFVINSEMSALTSRKHYFSITHNEKDQYR